MPASDPSSVAAIAALLARPTDRREERRILDLLTSCPAEDLDAVVASGHLPALLSTVDDRLFGPDHRAALLELLAERRVGDLGGAARAALVRALARGRTGARDERAIGAVFLATRGAALTELKEAIDGGGDHSDLVEVVFHDVDDPGVRSAILAHVAAEATTCAGLKVLSDIDDTFYANWKDERYPSKMVYPGVRQLYAELLRTPADPEAAAVTFITARPEDPLGLVEDATHRSLAGRGLPRARVLSGAFTHLIGNDSIAAEKLHNFERYRAVYPEYSFVFCGDSGQGDILFGERLLQEAPSAVSLILIHDVVATPDSRREELRARGVHLYDTYVGAATAAFDAGLIDAEAAGRVAAAAERELAAVPFASEAQRAARRAELSRDVALCAERLRAPRP